VPLEKQKYVNQIQNQVGTDQLDSSVLPHRSALHCMQGIHARMEVATYYQPGGFCNMQEDQTGGNTYAHSPPCSPAAATLLQPTAHSLQHVARLAQAHPPTATRQRSRHAQQRSRTIAACR
jgi:hypothetical protein